MAAHAVLIAPWRLSGRRPAGGPARRDPGRESVRNRTMTTARENILMAYRHQEPCWVPSQALDQDTCLPSSIPEGPNGFGVTTDVFGVSWTFEKGMEGPMVTIGTKRLADIAGWRDELTIPDPSTYKWEEGARKDTASWDRENRIGSLIIVDGLFGKNADTRLRQNPPRRIRPSIRRHTQAATTSSVLSHKRLVLFFFVLRLLGSVHPGWIFSKVCLQRAIFSTIDSMVAVQTKGFGFAFHASR